MRNEAIWQAVLQDDPLLSDQNSFPPKDAQMIVMLRKLKSIGIPEEELYRLCAILQDETGGPEKVRRLRMVRFQLLSRLHKQQQVLDDLDYYTDTLKKARD